MSVSESSGALSDVAVLRWTGYGLAAASVAVFVARLFQPGVLWTSVLLAMAVVSLVVVFQAPAAFETRTRGGGRGFNPLVGAPAFLLCAITFGVQVDDLTLPVAGAAIGAAVLLVTGMVALSRSGLASPMTFLIVAALMGAAAGYGALVAIDVDYDGAPPQTLTATVLDKYVTYGRHSTNYHLKVAPFGARRAESRLNVDRATYAALGSGSEACVLEHRGALGVSWVQLCGHG